MRCLPAEISGHAGRYSRRYQIIKCLNLGNKVDAGLIKVRPMKMRTSVSDGECCWDHVPLLGGWSCSTTQISAPARRARRDSKTWRTWQKGDTTKFLLTSRNKSDDDG